MVHTNIYHNKEVDDLIRVISKKIARITPNYSQTYKLIIYDALIMMEISDEDIKKEIQKLRDKKILPKKTYFKYKS